MAVFCMKATSPAPAPGMATASAIDTAKLSAPRISPSTRSLSASYASASPLKVARVLRISSRRWRFLSGSRSASHCARSALSLSFEFHEQPLRLGIVAPLADVAGEAAVHHRHVVLARAALRDPPRLRLARRDGRAVHPLRHLAGELFPGRLAELLRDLGRVAARHQAVGERPHVDRLRRRDGVLPLEQGRAEQLLAQVPTREAGAVVRRDERVDGFPVGLLAQDRLDLGDVLLGHRVLQLGHVGRAPAALAQVL